MELNQVTSVSELFWKFLPHTNMYNALKDKTMNDDQSKKTYAILFSVIKLNPK